MKMLSLILSLLLLLRTNSIAQNSDAQQSVQQVLDGSTKPFPEFARRLASITLPPLPSPGSKGSDEIMSDVRDILWKRMRALDLSSDASNKKELLDTLGALCKIRKWLLKHAAYTNIVFTSYIDSTVSMAVLSALSKGSISADEARKICMELTPRTSAIFVLDAVQPCAPNSEALTKFKQRIRSNEVVSLFDLANNLGHEKKELLDTRLPSLLSDVHPASLVQHAVEGVMISFAASGLIDYAGKGGNLNANMSVFEADFAKRTPELIGIIEPVSQTELSAAMYSALLENVREWKPKP